jgi:energy-coupling factor transporter ATP-binding protein EcfA2
MLIIDEPELNLHPDNQRKMAALLARLVNAGIKIIVTTHSDYLIRDINNRIMLNNDISNKAELMKKQGLIGEDILRPEQVAAYNLGTAHTITPVRVDQYGIDMTIFDELIADANQAADDIYYCIKE